MSLPNDPHTGSNARPRTIYTRGNGCAELADALAGGDAVRASGDLLTACVDARAELLVTKRVPTSSSIASATPVDFAPDGARTVVALVSGGPHSELAARVAYWVGGYLGVPAALVAGYRVPDERDMAQSVVDRIGPRVPDLDARTVEAWTGKQLLEEIDENALLVFGAAGGSWIQRLFVGPGARLASGAPGGAVVVRHVEPPAFQTMEEPVYVSPLLSCADALLVSDDLSIPVVDVGRLVGVVWRSVLVEADPDAVVSAVMGTARSLAPSASQHDVVAFRRETGLEPVPICGNHGQFLGVVRARS